MSEGRDKLRSKVFSEKAKVILIDLDDGQQIEVRQPTIGMLLDVVSLEDLKSRMSQMLIKTCYVPGTNEKVFDESDKDILMELPQGGVYQKLIDTIQANMNLPAKVEEAAKD